MLKYGRDYITLKISKINKDETISLEKGEYSFLDLVNIIENQCLFVNDTSFRKSVSNGGKLNIFMREDI